MNAISRLGNIFEDVAIKAPVRVASTAEITMSGLPVVDGVQLIDGDRILVKDQADATLNGIYQASTGIWLRTADARDNTDFVNGTLVNVVAGIAAAGEMFVLLCDDSPVIVGSSELVFRLQSDVTTARQQTSSATSLTIGLGALSLAVEDGKDFTSGEYVLIYQTSNPANAMLAQITDYESATLQATSVSMGGAGTFSDWTVVLANSPAAAGRIPPIGTGNANGPGSSHAGNVPVFSDNTGKNFSDSGKVLGVLGSRDKLLYGDAGPQSIGETAFSPGAISLPFAGTQSTENLHLSNDVSNPNRDIAISPGRCRDDADGGNLFLRAAIIKRMDMAWSAGGAAGSPGGACDSGSKGAFQTWHFFLIAKRGLVVTAFQRVSNVATITVAAHGAGVGGTFRCMGIGSGFDSLRTITAVTTDTISFANTGDNVAATPVTASADIYDVIASQSYDSPTLPSGWTAKQCLGSILTDGSGNIRGFTQLGDEFLLTVSLVSGIPMSSVATLFDVSVPKGVKLYVLLRYFCQATTTPPLGLITSPDEPDNPATGSSAQISAAGSGQSGGEIIARTNTNSQLRSRFFNGAAVLNGQTRGWRDPRRRLF